MSADRRTTVGAWAAAVVVLLAGLGLSLGATVGALEPTLVLLVGGLAALAVAVGLAVGAAYLGRSRAVADALVVMGFMYLHLFALAVALLSAGWWLLGDAGSAGTVTVAWGGASAAGLAISYLWDRHSETDVDEALAGWDRYPG